MDVKTERGGEVAPSGALELSRVEIGLDLEGRSGGGGDRFGGGEGAESEVGSDNADGGGAVFEGELENAAGEGGVGGDGNRRVDEGRHDNGAVDFQNYGVAGFREIIDATGLADADDASVADQNRAVGNDS